jgi:DnaJ-class molecular chaperone
MTTCTECSGRGWFYSDTGPSGDRDVCNSCDGAGDWDDTGYIERAVVRSPVMMGAACFDGEVVSPSVAGELRSLGRLAA